MPDRRGTGHGGQADPSHVSAAGTFSSSLAGLSGTRFVFRLQHSFFFTRNLFFFSFPFSSFFFSFEKTHVMPRWSGNECSSSSWPISFSFPVSLPFFAAPGRGSPAGEGGGGAAGHVAPSPRLRPAPLAPTGRVGPHCVIRAPRVSGSSDKSSSPAFAHLEAVRPPPSYFVRRYRLCYLLLSEYFSLNCLFLKK